MSVETPNSTIDAKPNKVKATGPKRVFIGFVGLLACLLACLCLFVIGLRVFITLPMGHAFIEKQVNTRSFGPIDSVKISGLSGDPLSDFQIGAVRLLDKDGVWATSENITMTWRPLSLLRKHVNIETLTLDAVTIQKRPNLLPTKESDLSLKITLGQMSIPTLSLAPDLLPDALLTENQNTPLVLNLDGGFHALESGQIKARLKAMRVDGSQDGSNDALTLDFERSNKGLISGTFDLRAKANSVLAALIQAPYGQNAIGRGTLSGDRQNGRGDFTLDFDGAIALTANTNWTNDRLTLTSSIPGRTWPLLAPLKTVKGTPKLSLEIERTKDEMPFQLMAEIGQVSLAANGRLPSLKSEGSRLPSQAKIDLSVRDPKALTPLPEGLSLSNFKLVGHVINSDTPRFNGTISAETIITPLADIASVTAPLTLSYSQQKTIAFNVDAALNAVSVKDDYPVKLDRKTDIKAAGVYDTKQKTLQLTAATLISGPQTLSTTGRVSLEPLNYDLSGRTNLALTQSGNIPEGDLRADYTIRKNEYPLPALRADGAFKPSSTPLAPLASLIGEQLVFDVDMTPIENGINLTKASLRADGFKGEASGTLANTLNISVETDLLSDIAYQEIALTRGSQMSATITGDPTDPNIKLDTTTPQIKFREYGLSDARLRAEITDINSAPKGPVRLNATSEYGDLDINASLSSTQSRIDIDDIRANLGTLSLRGDLNLTDMPESPKKLAAGTLSLDLPKEGNRYAKAVLTLDIRDGKQGVSIEADAKNMAYKSTEFDSFALSGDGTLAAFTGSLATKGQNGSDLIKTPFLLETPISFARREDNNIIASFSPNANYGRIPLRASKPLTLEIKNGDIGLSAGFTVRDGTFAIDYNNGRSERLQLTLANMPVNILPLGTALSETRGRTDANLDIGFENGQAKGGLSATLKDWRGFERKKSEALTIDMNGQWLQNAMDIKITGTSPLGFDMNGATRLALTHDGSLASLRPNRDAPLNGTLRARGAAGALLGLVTPKDSALSGQLDANLSLSGTLNSPKAQGEINGNRLQFEAPQLGTQIREGQFALDFTNDSLTLSEISATGSKKGTLKGSGQFTLGAFGRPLGKMDVTLERFQALDRRDLSARLSGPVSVEIKEKTTLIGGQINILNAEIKQFVTGGVNVVEIEVEEINAPPNIQTLEKETPALPVDLNLNITAPRKIFVRSKGLDVELSLDAEIKGTLDAPKVFGQADILRGGYSIAGKTLAFDRGTVKFDGDIPKARLDFLASTQTQNLDAVVTITGTVEDPEITLSSTPSRPQDEILSAILFGRSATELSTIEAAQLAGAIAQFSGSGGFDLLGGFRDALGIGQLSLGFNEDGGAMITGGRYLAKNVYLQVFSGIGSNDSGAVIDWEIRKNISLRSRLQSDNDQSLSLKWKRDF